MLRRMLAGWLLAWLLLPALAHAVNAQATLDRPSVRLGETVTLNLHIDGAGSGIDMPDLHLLSADFDILGTSQNSSLSVVNGTATSSLTFGVALRPRHAGTLLIPALSIAGGRTAPLQLQVDEAEPRSPSTHPNVFMEARIEPAQGYVGQQLSYVLQLYYATNIANGALNAPELDGVEVSRMGADLNYDAERGGRSYHVLERRYALIPQHAGHLEVPAAHFQGESIDPEDPNSFFGAGIVVSASAPAVAIDVQAIPADWGKSAWLPARALSLSLDGWPDAKDPVRVGQPLELTMNLQATGLPFETLPALSLPPLDDAKAYPDKPVAGTRQDGQWLVGRRQQTFAIVPEHAGTLTIPATSVKWWNVLAGRAEVAQIPAHSVMVLPAIGAVDVQPSEPAPTSRKETDAAPASMPLLRWRWIALAGAGLGLALLGAWWLWRRRTRTSPVAVAKAPHATPRQLQRAFLAVARGSDVAAQVTSLLAWARAERPAMQHLGDVADALDDAAQRAAISTLQRLRYAGAPSSGDATTLVDAFARGFVWRVATGDEHSPLPPLYPFKLR